MFTEEPADDPGHIVTSPRRSVSNKLPTTLESIIYKRFSRKTTPNVIIPATVGLLIVGGYIGEMLIID